MDTTPTPANSPPERKPAPLTFSALLEAVWNCAWETLVLTFLVRIFGSITFGIVSGLWHDMGPSLPPVLSPKPSPEAGAHFQFGLFHRHGFVLLYSVLFLGKLAGKLLPWSPHSWQRERVAWLKTVFQKIYANWFGLIVGNAFAALGTAIALGIATQFSSTHMLWTLLVQMFSPLGHLLVSPIAGTAFFRAVESTVSWYGDNQFKFLFWALYSTAICDDLGLPNWKSLLRLLWRHLVPRKNPSPSVPVPPPTVSEQKRG